MGETVTVHLDGGIARITLNRPTALNAFDDEMGADFLAALRSADADEVRAVIVTGAGKAFCAGEDLRALAADYQAGSPQDLGEILRRRYNPAIEAIISLRKPVVAAVNGVAAGAGVSLALACDMRLIADNASLVLAFSKVALVPDSGGTWLLPRYLGLGRALELAMSGDPVSAMRALELGLVTKVVPDEELSDACEELASSLASGPTAAYGTIKQLIWSAGSAPLHEHLENEAKAQSAAGRTEDHLEGVGAFLAKRPPDFKGR